MPGLLLFQVVCSDKRLAYFYHRVGLICVLLQGAHSKNQAFGAKAAIFPIVVKTVEIMAFVDRTKGF